MALNRPPRILMVASSFPRWEGDHYGIFVSLVARELANRCHEVVVLAPHDPGAQRRESDGGLTIRRFRYFLPSGLQRLCYRGGMISAVRQGWFPKAQVITFLAAEVAAVRRALDSSQFDLLHFHWALPQGMAVSMARVRRRLPVVGTFYGGDVSIFARGWKARMVRAACEAADVIVPISRATRDALLTVSPDAKARTRIIPMPVDADRFAIPSATAPTGFPSDRPVLLCVGRLAREKGFEYAIRAMPIVRQSYPQASLVIVGRGPDAQRLQALAEELLGPGVCRFPGFVAAEALPAYYAHADVFLLPSVLDDTGWQEGMGIVILEAAVAGCPAVATRVGGTSDVLVDGETGILVPERDAAALARAALAIISSASMRQRFAAGAHARAIENFSVQSVATQYEDAYRAALAGRGTGGPR